MKVCFISLSAYPFFNTQIEAAFGGAERDLYLLATELAKDKEYEVSFVLGDYGQEKVEFRENVRLIKSAQITRNLFMQAPQIWRALHLADADIYMSKACSLGTVLNAIFCKYYRRKFVYRTASTMDADNTYLRDNPLRGRAFYWSLRKANAVIAQNESDKENLLKNVGVESIVIRNGDKLQQLRNAHRNTILWVGRSAHVKRPDLFLRIAEERPDLCFKMVCQQSSDNTDYGRLIAKAKTITNLEFVPYVPFNQIEKYFLNAKILVNTSDFEGFPNTFIQACKCGTPILSLNVNPDDFLNKYKCGLCAKGDLQSFKKMLAELLKPEIGKLCGDNGSRYAFENHNITKIIEQYKGLFLNINTI